MTIFDVLSLICGLALFLYGMEVMGDALKKSAGNSLKTILGKMTSNPVKGFLLGLGVTAVIQSSSATTVMVVGFVNSGTMTLLQAAGVIMGANVGTAVTSWITGLSGLGASGEAAASLIKWFKPDSWMPIIALMGICLIMFAKRGRKRRRQKQSFPVATLVTLVCLAAGALYLFVYGSDQVRDFRLDRTEAITVSAQGTAVSAGRVRAGKHRYQYRLELDCGGETLTLHIHKSLMDAYALEPGAVYDITYYPRTKTLCEAEKAE